MLTIGKIGGTGGGQWRSAEYYTEQVARGAEDYYAGHGEAPGTWTGQGATGLGLAGEVGDGELEAVFERFSRVDAARSRAAGGSGIGLVASAALSQVSYAYDDASRLDTVTCLPGAIAVYPPR